MTITLDLIDPQLGLPLQSWTIEPGRRWHIGRADEAEIHIPNPYVSRSHARIEERSGVWELTNLSSNGTYVDDARHEQITLEDGLEFRLSVKGPLLRFRQVSAEPPPASATISFDPDTMPALILSSAERDREVAEIVSDPYFREVQELAERMRRQRRDQST